jgi:type I restriction enzyme M protein
MGKTNPLNDADLAEFVRLQKTKAGGEKSWTVDVADVDAATCDLSVKNPHAPEAEAQRTPQQIIDGMLARDVETAKLLARVREML